MSDAEHDGAPYRPIPPAKEPITNPGVAIATLKAQAKSAEQALKKTVRGNRINLGLVLAVLTVTGGAFIWILGEARARAETVMVPVVKDVADLKAWAKTHEAAQAETQKQNVHELERANDKIDALLIHFGVPQPPPREVVDSGRQDGGP